MGETRIDRAIVWMLLIGWSLIALWIIPGSLRREKDLAAATLRIEENQQSIIRGIAALLICKKEELETIR